MKIDITKIRPLYKTKKNPQVVDPQRIPKIMEPIERGVKESYAIGMNKMMIDLTKKMVEFSESNRTKIK